jgi:hypothetical protein
MVIMVAWATVKTPYGPLTHNQKSIGSEAYRINRALSVCHLPRRSSGHHHVNSPLRGAEKKLMCVIIDCHGHGVIDCLRVAQCKNQAMVRLAEVVFIPDPNSVVATEGNVHVLPIDCNPTANA